MTKLADIRRQRLWCAIGGLSVAIAVVLGLGLGPNAAVAQTVLPNTPTNVTVTRGDTEASISWQSGGTGVSGTCASSEYYVTVYDASQQSFPAVAESLPITGATSWYVDELTPATKYYVTVEAFGSTCGKYSQNWGTATFTTWAGPTAGDPSAPSSRKKRAPAKVGNLRVDPDTHGQVTISWIKPRDIGTKRNVRCPYTYSASDDHADEDIEYNYYVDNLSTGAEVADEYFSSDEQNLSKVVTNGRLGVGDRFRAEVSAYSGVCDSWSSTRVIEWWQ